MHLSLIFYLLLQIALILALSRAMGLLFKYLRQPQVMGEMVAGIMLGPSLFGWVAPTAWAAIFRPDTFPGSGITADPTVYLNILSQIGVMFFLFLVGLELDPKLLKNRGHTAVVVSHVSILAPFLLGAVLTLFLYRDLFNDAPHMKFLSVALFLGAAMSITAFPVLARILSERNLHKTKVGAIAITCAAVDDVTAWCMLAFVVGIARAAGLWPGLLTAGMSVVYVAFMFFAVRPFLRRLQVYHDRRGRLSQNIVAIIFIMVLVSAFATEAIGIHALFGAFLLGALMPKGTQFVRDLSQKLEDYTVVLLLPIFFAYTGLRTQIGLLDNTQLWLYTGVIIAVACLGKFGGSTIAARACGLSWRESAVIGTLMNTRGLMELVILNIGLQEGVITPAVFAMMVIMALVTTALTTPILHWLYPSDQYGGAEAAAKESRAARSFSILIPVALPDSGIRLARIAAALLGKSTEGGKLVPLHLRRPTEADAYRGSIDTVVGEDPTLAPFLTEAARLGAATEPISFVTRDAADDICAVASAQHFSLALMGFHKPVFGRKILGGTVHRVLSACETNVAVFVDRGFKEAKKILVPYLGSRHDRLAMELADRMGRSTGAAITVLHVVPPQRDDSVRTLDAKRSVDRVFNDAAQPAPVEFRVVENNSPVAAVLAEADKFDLVIIGVAEEWGLESHLFGWRPERIAQECPVSMLIVRRYASAAQPQAVVDNSSPAIP